MDCPHCHSSSTTEREGRTVHGFRRFRCRDCGQRFNERTGTVLNRVQVPTDIVFLVVFWRLRYKLSLRDLACGYNRRKTPGCQRRPSAAHLPAFPAPAPPNRSS
jgi:hypothetical protein